MLFQALKSHIYDNIKLQVKFMRVQRNWPGLEESWKINLWSQFLAWTSWTLAKIVQNFTWVAFYKQYRIFFLLLNQYAASWHGLHGLKIEVLKISLGWPFTGNREHLFFNPYVAFWHGLHGLSKMFSQSWIKSLKSMPKAASTGWFFSTLWNFFCKSVKSVSRCRILI